MGRADQAGGDDVVAVVVVKVKMRRVFCDPSVPLTTATPPSLCEEQGLSQ